MPPVMGTALDRADGDNESREEMGRGMGMWFEVALGKIPSVGVRGTLRTRLEVSENDTFWER